MAFCRGKKLFREHLQSLGSSFYFSLFSPHNEPARKFPLHRRVQRVCHLTQFTKLVRDGRAVMEPSSLLSHPRLHLPLKSSLSLDLRFFPDPTGGCFCRSQMVGGVWRSQCMKGRKTPSVGETPADTCVYFEVILGPESLLYIRVCVCVRERARERERERSPNSSMAQIRKLFLQFLFIRKTIATEC